MFKQGPNKFRILSAPVMGWEYWTESKKPVRAKKRWTTIPADADISGKNGWNPKHFWAFLVWNFDTKMVEVLEITQTTIQTAMEELIHSEEWGSPLGYSITIRSIAKVRTWRLSTVLYHHQRSQRLMQFSKLTRKSQLTSKRASLVAILSRRGFRVYADDAGPGKGENGDWSNQDQSLSK